MSSFKQVPKSLDKGMKQIVPSQSAFVVQFDIWSLILSKQSWSEQLDIVLSNGCPSLSPVCKVKCGGRKALKMGQGHIATSGASTAKLNQLVMVVVLTSGVDKLGYFGVSQSSIPV